MTSSEDVLGTPGLIADGGMLAGWGDLTTPIEAIHVAWSVTAALLGELSDAAPSLVLTRTNPFFAPPRGFDPAIVPSDDDWVSKVESDPVVARKRALFDSGRVAVAFAPSAWDLGSGATARSLELAQFTGWGAPEARPEAGAAVLELAATQTVDEIAAAAAEVLGSPRALVIGNGQARTSSVAFIAGIASPAQLRELLRDPAIGAAVVGETVEWEGAPYTQDAAAAGRHLAVIAVGTALSENPAGAALARRLAVEHPQLTVQNHPTDEATWMPHEEVHA
ncbi:hypothetical protein [Gryllotalpicola koreensis]|uniref:Uncharacterized protein n=1 Tax=Gryllotalpicola koreensis TaxID=993086 RepID=A0ABP7ZQY7_9MICO